MGCGVSTTDAHDNDDDDDQSSSFQNGVPPPQRSRSTKLTKKELDQMNKDEKERMGGAISMYCTPKDCLSETDSDDSDYDSDGSYASTITRQSSTDSFTDGVSSDDGCSNMKGGRGANLYQKALKKGERKRMKQSQGRVASGERVGVSAGIANVQLFRGSVESTNSSVNNDSYCQERSNSFEDREDEIASALAEVRARHDESLKKKKERRRSLREREKAMKRREAARVTGGVKLPPINANERKRENDEMERAQAIVDEAIEERKAMETMSLAEQGRQRTRTKGKRVKNFFNMPKI